MRISSTCRRPAVSITIASRPSSSALSRASFHEPLGFACDGRSARAHRSARQAPRAGRSPRTVQVRGDEQRMLSLRLEPFGELSPVVVLPEPCRPTINTTSGGRDVTASGTASRRESPPIRRGRCGPPAGRGPDSCTPRHRRCVPDPIEETLDDFNVDVRLEQRQTDLSESGGDITIRKPPLRSKPLEHSPQARGEGVEHVREVRRSSS